VGGGRVGWVGRGGVGGGGVVLYSINLLISHVTPSLFVVTDFFVNFFESATQDIFVRMCVRVCVREREKERERARECM